MEAELYLPMYRKTGEGIMEHWMETTIVYWGYKGIMENKLEATMVYWGYKGIMENKMEATMVYWGYIYRLLTFSDPVRV